MNLDAFLEKTTSAAHDALGTVMTPDYIEGKLVELKARAEAQVPSETV